MKRSCWTAACLFSLVIVAAGCAEKAKSTATEKPEGTAVTETPKPEASSKAALKENPQPANDVPPLEAPSPDGMNRLKPEEISDGWLRLFDGSTLFGWKSNTKLGWSVNDGVITADSDKSEDKCLLVTTTRFADYELRCDYRVAAGGNSGIFLRTPLTPTDPAVDCYELNMCDSHAEFGTGSLVKRAQPTKAVKGDGEWHTFQVRLEGPKITAQFDGDPVLDYTDATEKPLTTGFIGLQMNGGKIEFRNVFLKPLNMKPLFDGESLKGWQEIPGGKSQFEAKDGTIHVLKGRGFLETESVAGNFVLQFDAITNGNKLNSGVFFRAQQGTDNGYEFQIQNGTRDGNRNAAEDHGTGAIFRRISARRVVSNDNEWFTATLVADGPHLSTWVNGIQVVDWTDERPANDNPRNGLRLAPGHINLQGHDDTTDVAFRNLKLAETPQ